MADALHMLARVAHLQAQDSSEDLQDIADQQRDKIDEKKTARALQEMYDKVTEDDVVEFDELVALHQFRSEVGTTEESFWNEDGRVRNFSEQKTGEDLWQWDDNLTGEHGNNSHYKMQMGDENAAQRMVKSKMNSISREIENHKDGIEDDESLLQFKIQMATSDMQNAESVRGQAEKRLQDHRNEMRRNWQG